MQCKSMDEKIVQKFLMLFTLMACWHTDLNPPCDSFPTVTTCQWSCEKVMFSVLSFCLQWGGSGGSMLLLPMVHSTSLYRAPLSPWYGPTRPSTWELTVHGDPPLLVTCGGHHWRPVNTWSHQALTSGGYWSRKWAVRILLECFLVL